MRSLRTCQSARLHCKVEHDTLRKAAGQSAATLTLSADDIAGSSLSDDGAPLIVAALCAVSVQQAPLAALVPRAWHTAHHQLQALAQPQCA